MELLAEVKERREDDIDGLIEAYELLNRAVVVCGRALGQAHEETIRLSLQALRVMIKCSSVKGYQAVGKKALEVIILLPICRYYCYDCGDYRHDKHFASCHTLYTFYIVSEFIKVSRTLVQLHVFFPHCQVSRRVDRLALVDPEAAKSMNKLCAELLAISRLLEEGATHGLKSTASSDSTCTFQLTRGENDLQKTDDSSKVKSRKLDRSDSNHHITNSIDQNIDGGETHKNGTSISYII